MSSFYKRAQRFGVANCTVVITRRRYKKTMSDLELEYGVSVPKRKSRLIHEKEMRKNGHEQTDGKICMEAAAKTACDDFTTAKG